MCSMIANRIDVVSRAYRCAGIVYARNLSPMVRTIHIRIQNSLL